MAENSAISWTENTFNPWIGCTKVSPGCAHCYAEREQDHRHKRAKWGPHGTRSLTSPSNWQKPLKWNADAQKSGQRIKVFCSSLADVFEDTQIQLQLWDKRTMWICPGCHAYRDGAVREVQKTGPHCSGCNLISHPLTVNDVRRRLFALIDDTPHLDWLLVTKRPENIRSMWPVVSGGGTPPNMPGNWSGRPDYRKNVWLLTSVENQDAADTRIPELLKCRDLSPVLGLSCEPLLGPVDLYSSFPAAPGPIDATRECEDGPGIPIDWVICGGESGPDARPMHPDWARSLRDQCQADGVPFHFKQWGEWVPLNQSPECNDLRDRGINPGFWNFDCDSCEAQRNSGVVFLDRSECSCLSVYKFGKKKAGRLLDGREWDEFPNVLAGRSGSRTGPSRGITGG